MDGQVEMVDGQMPIPTGQGIGAEVNEAMVER
jgi:hypothetical protein